MMAYLDENGNLSSTPPDPKKKFTVKAEDIEISVSGQRATEAQEKLRTGIVTFFDEDKGYGFIKDLNTQESIFVHVNAVTFDIKENNMVTFETENGFKGLNAVNVKKI